MTGSTLPQPATDAPPGASSMELFDRRRRAARRARRRAGDGFIDALIADAMLERLEDVTRDFADVLIIGARSPALIAAIAQPGRRVTVWEHSATLAASIRAALPAGAVLLVGEEEALDVPPASFDLLLWPGGIETLSDVPGVLLRARLALRPDGLMLAALLGGDCLPRLRAALRAGRAMVEPQRIVARANPQIDVAAAGNLLSRAGFAMPVADVDSIRVAVRTARSLIRDLRDAAATALIAGPVHPMTRQEWAAIDAAFLADADAQGRVADDVRLLWLSGWAPAPTQVPPARRGSARVSLSTALKDRSTG